MMLERKPNRKWYKFRLYAPVKSGKNPSNSRGPNSKSAASSFNVCHQQKSFEENKDRQCHHINHKGRTVSLLLLNVTIDWNELHLL